MKQKLPTRTPEEQAFDTRVADLAATAFKLTNDLIGSIRIAAHLAAAQMATKGEDEEEADRLLNDYLRRFVERDEGVPVSDELQRKLIDTFVDAGGKPPKQLLLEHLVGKDTGYRMWIYPNESKHPGNPHVTVILDGKKVNISISRTPKVLAPKKNHPRGTSEAVNAVAAHQKALMKDWRRLRPDDQKIENFKAKQPRKKPGTSK
jgi:hypothetical protein